MLKIHVVFFLQGIPYSNKLEVIGVDRTELCFLGYTNIHSSCNNYLIDFFFFCYSE